MKTQRYLPYLSSLLTALLLFTMACGTNAGEETTDTSDSLMYTAPDAEDANYDNEVTVEQATPFSAETATMTVEEPVDTQPDDQDEEPEAIEYFSNEYEKAYSTSTSDQRAVVPGFDSGSR